MPTLEFKDMEEFMAACTRKGEEILAKMKIEDEREAYLKHVIFCSLPLDYKDWWIGLMKKNYGLYRDFSDEYRRILRNAPIAPRGLECWGRIISSGGHIEEILGDNSSENLELRLGCLNKWKKNYKNLAQS